MFVLKLLGWNNVRNYDGSMREWANRDDTPLVLEPS
jgi:3-mercaptopyruvate sulfurtransferase SseA